MNLAKTHNLKCVKPRQKVAMKICDFPIDFKVVKDNYDYWKNKFVTNIKPSAENIRIALTIPTTHTFGMQNSIKTINQDGTFATNSKGEFIYEVDSPYKNIFFKSQAILSDAVRNSTKGINNEFKRKMHRIRDLKLNWFVFSSLGIHNPKFAGKPLSELKPFGVFINKTSEEFPNCHVSRRDIDEKNPEINLQKINDVFKYVLSPCQARSLLPKEIAFDDRFNNDFFEYWGKDSHWYDEDIILNHWQWKYEFRFFKEIPISNIEAVLWPDFREFDTKSNRYVTWGIEELSNLETIYPHLKTLCYPWDYEAPSKSFWNASYKVSLFYSKNERFPDSWLEVKDLVG